jgi:isoaspartyl peptidase/L-asparaginase-like protein (Ntn-hydrolase superfamily)
MNTRRSFLKKSALFTSLASLLGSGVRADVMNRVSVANRPIVISTWDHGIPANEAAWKILSAGGKAIDAVEAGVKVPEADPKVKSVGYGGYPDVDGRLTLDASIMDENQQCGSVACLEHIMHPISVARLVMEKTRHVMLVGDGALEFALQQGFKKENLITPESLKEWQELKEELKQKRSIVNIENHDTISMLAIDAEGNMSGSCTTSGAAVKMHGRVGDSPIIGAGLFVDNTVGAACATGVGEEVIKQAGSAMVVELMRSGMEPEQACREIVKRILRVNKDHSDLQVGFLALRKDGAVGAFAIRSDFNYAVCDKSGNRLIDCKSMLD